MGVDVMNLFNQKKQARTQAFARRAQAFAQQKPGACDLLADIVAQYQGAPIAGFMPINTEIDPRPAMAQAVHHGPVGVPVIMAPATPLKFARWTPDTPMVEGAFKAQIPAVLDWIVPDVVIVPLVAFDRRGGRLGYGGGFYDRTIEGLRTGGTLRTIGFAFNAQEAENLPLEPTDQPLDIIVTEDKVITPRDHLPVAPTQQ